MRKQNMKFKKNDTATMTATTTNEVCIASLLEYFCLVGWIDLCWQGMKIW